MSTGYQINDQEGMYYLTFQVVDWIDVFTRHVYRDIEVVCWTGLCAGGCGYRFTMEISVMCSRRLQFYKSEVWRPETSLS